MKNSDGLWTLDELTAAVEAALAEGYEGPASGRVRDVPDRRTIRYYTTLGLIDRAAAMRGRTALYGRRHLLQVVAIKKLQARGKSLAEIQHALAGRPDAELARIAAIDAGSPAEDAAPRSAARPDRDFWRQVPDDSVPSIAADEDERSPAVAEPGPVEERARALSGVALSAGVTLLLAPSRPIEAHDMEAIRTAAAPLIRALILSRLIDPCERGDLP
jgi:DNA-binding transcriptional MerR regulator